MLELLFKGLLQWLFDMIINITEYLANSLLTIFTMDLAYFEKAVPVTGDIFNIIICLGWALMLGNLTFQSAKTMMTGLGFEGEAPQSLFARTFVMTFLMVFSRQVCDIGLGIAKGVIELLEVPEIVQVPKLTESTFHVPGDASWLLVIIIGVILVVQIIKLFFEIGERYVVLAVLTVLSPLAFSMGGSKNTADIFKGWARMFGSMCLMVVLSVVFLKFMLSAMSVVPSGVEVIPWTIFVVAIAKTGRKIDALIMRIGLNPSATGDPLGGISRMPGMLTCIVARNMAQNIGKSAAAGTSHNGQSGFRRSGGTGTSPTSPARPGPVSGGGAAVVRSSAEFAAETAASPMHANVQSAGGTGTLHKHSTPRPPSAGTIRTGESTAPQNMGVSAMPRADAGQAVSAESAQNRNPAQPATQNSGRNTVSTEARRASVPSAARPTAQTRMAQTAGMVQNAGQGDTKPHNLMGGAANPPGTGNAGISHTGRNTADSPLLHNSMADIRSSASSPANNTARDTGRTENTSHSENISVQHSQTNGRPSMQNGASGTGASRPSAAEVSRQTRPPVHSGGGALRQSGTPEGRQGQSRPDSMRQGANRQETAQAGERVLIQETAKMTGENLHSHTHVQTAPSSGGTKPTATNMAGGSPRPIPGRETMRGAAVQKAMRDSAPEKGLKMERADRRNAVPNREHTPNEHRQSPVPSPAAQGRESGRSMEQRKKPTAANPSRRAADMTGDERR